MWGGRGARSLSALLVFTVPLLQVHCHDIYKRSVRISMPHQIKFKVVEKYGVVS